MKNELSEADQRRVAHGLKPFAECKLAPRERPANEFSSYAEAAAYAEANGGVARCARVDGGPPLFRVVARPGRRA